jgi:hypothetical protein
MERFIRAGATHNLSAIKNLVSEGADIHFFADLALRVAVITGQLEYIKYFLSKGADIHTCNDTAVRTAACDGNLEIVKYLVSNGANIYISAKHNINAIKCASVLGHFEIVKYFVSLGASIRHLSRKDKLHFAPKIIYYWWIQHSYQISRPSGIRMMFASLTRHEDMCAS